MEHKMKKYIDFISMGWRKIKLFYYYISLQFIADKIEKQQCPNGTWSERILLILKTGCLFLALLLFMELATRYLESKL